MRRVLTLSFFALLPAAITMTARPQSGGSTIQATSCQQSDVNAVLNGPKHTAVNGDTIQIPAGTCTWTSGISIPSGIGITIIGAGIPNNTANTTGAASSSTTIVDAIPSGSSPNEVFLARPSYGAATMRISTLTITPASGANPYSPVGVFGKCSASGCPNMRLDNITFPSAWAVTNNLQDAALVLANDMFGVLDHNTVTGNNNSHYLGFANFSDGNWMGVGQFGDNSWAQPDSFGTNQAIYLENNTLDTNIVVVDCDASDSFQDTGGCRYVARFNNVIAGSTTGIFINHGTETTGRPRGGRQTEIYNNTISCTNTSSGCSSAAGFRSGVNYVFGNALAAASGSWFNSVMNLVDYRTFAGFDPWGYCDGQGPWDSNDGTVYASGTITSVSTSGSALTVTDNTQSWAASQWVNSGAPYSIVDTSVNATAGSWTGHPGYEITGSTSGSVTAASYSDDYWNGPPTFNVGDSYQILRAKYCIDQPSRSGGTLLSGAPPTSTGWVNEVLDPSYEWGDTHTGSFNYAPATAGTKRLLANRDFYYEVSQSAQTSSSSPFNGTVGTGFGTLANRPASCTAGVAYWATDQGNWNQSGSGGQGELFKCTAANTWTVAYTPYTYPHPLISGSPSVYPDSPTGLNGTVQ